MDIQRLDHFTLRTPLLADTIAFFKQVAGLRVGKRPPFTFDGCWLYNGELPVLHLVDVNGDCRFPGQYDAARKKGVIDHIAFRCTDLPSFEQRLRDLGIAYQARTVPELLEHQVFVTDPNGQVIEFIFNSSELASWKGYANYPAAN